MRYAIRTTTPGLHDHDHGDAAAVDQDARYGVAVRDMFSDASWSPVEPVRARDWRDTGEGSPVASETEFD